MGKTFSTGLLTNGIFQDSSNNIGIGAAANASFKLQVTGTTNLTGALSGTSATFSGPVVFGAGTFVSNTARFYTDGLYGAIFTGRTGTACDLLLTDRGGNLAFQIVNNGSTPNVIMNGGGNVGIGTSSPNTKLHIEGSGDLTSKIKSTSSNGVPNFIASNDLNENCELGIWGSARTGFGAIQPSNGYIYSGTDLAIGSTTNIKFGTGVSNTERMRITSGGRGLFGTNTPSAGASGFATSSFQVQGEVISKGSLAGFFWENRSGGTTDQSNWYGWYTLGGTIFLYNGAGNIANINSTTGIYTSTSDIKKKKDFEPYTNNGLTAILGLKPTLYRMINEEGTEKHLGFIAQEVQPFIPQAYVETIADEKDGGVHIGLDYQAITVNLVKAVQEQQAQIEELRQIVATK